MTERTGDMGDNSCRTGCRGLRGFLLRSKYPRSDEPNAFVDFLDAEFPASTVVDPLARQLLPHPAPSSIIAATPHLARSSAKMVVAMPVSDDATRRRILL